MTPLNIDDILKLIEICLKSTFFQWHNQIYQQIKGTPMGSPISVIIAEITMQMFEKKLSARSSIVPDFWNRFVDDTISTLKTEDIEKYH